MTTTPNPQPAPSLSSEDYGNGNGSAPAAATAPAPGTGRGTGTTATSLAGDASERSMKSSSGGQKNIPNVTMTATVPSMSNTVGGTTSATTASSTPPSTTKQTTDFNPTDQAVLDYLTKKGMGTAALELTNLLKQQRNSQQSSSASPADKDKAAGNKDPDGDENMADADHGGHDSISSIMQKVTSGTDDANNTVSNKELSLRERLEEEDAWSRAQRTLLSKSTGGGYGYDRDAAWPLIQWGIPDVNVKQKIKTARNTTTTATTRTTTTMTAVSSEDEAAVGVEEARAYLDAFTAMQLWVLSLPDHDGYQLAVENPIERARTWLLQQQQKQRPSNTDPAKSSVESIQAILQEIISYKAFGSKTYGGNAAPGTTTDFLLPPSAKPELLAITFALLVHTYCELLEVGMETTAQILRDAFEPIYDPLYKAEYRDLHHCNSTEEIMRLNSHNSQHMEALADLKAILVQVANYQMRRDELSASSGEPQHRAAEQKLQEYDQYIELLRRKYNEYCQRASSAFEKMHHLPFLRRARAVRWQLTMSTATYALLAQFFNGRDETVLPMSTLLQTKCELHVERRDPLPFTPSCVLDPAVAYGSLSDSKSKDGSTTAPGSTLPGVISARGANSRSGAVGLLEINQAMINWAAPFPRQREENRDGGKLPFPKYRLAKDYDTEEAAAQDTRTVAFNRALLVNGFRRLEALERKREYDGLSAATKKRLRQGEARQTMDPLKPTILLTSIFSSASAPALRSKSATSIPDVATIWEEAGIGLCCAKLCPPDARRVAVGCDDSAIRIWDLSSHACSSNGEPSQVLLGHKNGFPVFCLDWNRDGRSLLSAGGDGSIRLWDTAAVGPFGEVAVINSKSIGSSSSSSASAGGSSSAKERSKIKVSIEDPSFKEPDMTVPGMRPETVPYSSGAALAVYRGHVPDTPVWAVAFSPAGYYFVSAGSDATARLWTTDRPVPVRLFVGHTANNVNCVAWHPNCNYIITGSDDKTCRVWDIQSGRTIRLLTGCAAGINVVQISPGGRYAAGADYTGVVHLWDLANGRKVAILLSTSSTSASTVVGRPTPPASHHNNNHPMIHSLSFSACGSALAVGGDDCCVRIWDVRSEWILQSVNSSNRPSVSVQNTPSKMFYTKRTLLMDLYYTRRNLLLSMGKVVTAVPTLAMVEDEDS